jgi:hypothetical protein
MKKFIILLALFSGWHAISQEINTIDVKGKVIVEGGDLIGISIFNKTSNKGTVTDENGEFIIAVQLNDSIQISALQFQNIAFKINEAIIESKTMKVFLIEEINRLDTIFVTENRLSKNLEVQIKRTEKFNPKLNNLYFGIANNKQVVGDDQNLPLKNMAIDTERLEFVNGLNIVNVVDQLLLPLFRSEVKDKKSIGIPEVPVESIRFYFGSEFLTDNFSIPEHRVEEFIRFVESDNFDFSLLNYGKEMELLEVIYNKSLLFLDKS